MKILRIRAEGLSRYRKPFDISFCAVQRVQSSCQHTVHRLAGSVCVNAVETFAGINASGKTTALRVISFVGMLLKGVSLSSDMASLILAENVQTVFTIDFFAGGKICRLTSRIIRTKDPGARDRVRILEEKLLAKSAAGRTSRANLSDFDGMDPVRVRKHAEEYLSDDVSVMIAVNRQLQDRSIFVSPAASSDFLLPLSDGGSVPAEILSLLDPSIVYLRTETVNERTIFRLKFQGQDELAVSGPAELGEYLSSGTLKGIRVFTDAVRALKNGGYLIADDIENHLNRELAASLIRLFLNPRTNQRSAVLIFSTHDPELLDETGRNDAVFLTRNDHGLTIDNLHSLLKRSDIPGSRIYRSNFLGGTAPSYEALALLQKDIAETEQA